MRLIRLTVENFRCYREPFTIRFGEITTLIGRNDVGKSTLMEALSIFFGKSKPDKDDACRSGDPVAMKITVEFDDLPETLVVDTAVETSLASEYMLSGTSTLVVEKTYNGGLAKPTCTSNAALALHPTAYGYGDLLALKRDELSARAEHLGVDCSDVDMRKNAEIRSAIWAHCSDLALAVTPVSLEIEGGKEIAAKLVQYMPEFALFKSDRASTDQDSEAQDPLKIAIGSAIKDVQDKLDDIKQHVETEVRKIADATLEKLREMDPALAESLDPVISMKKGDGLFSTSITGEEGIPLNKRGSGVRRLILLNFFRAKAERDAQERSAGSVIYAIEEPETSQHPKNQRIMLNSFRDLALAEGRQIILTTHTPTLARLLPLDTLRFLDRAEDGAPQITEGGEDSAAAIAASLGVMPDHDVKLFIGVEGPNDINYLCGMAKILRAEDEDVPDLEALEAENAVIFVPMGGSTLTLWSSRLKGLNRPELYICDRDNEPTERAHYQDFVDDVNTRPGCFAILTTCRETENYLHPEAIRECYSENGTELALPVSFAPFDDVPAIVAEAAHAAAMISDPTNCVKSWDELSDAMRGGKVSRAKKQLNRRAVLRMNAARLTQCDPSNEVRGWFQRITAMMNTAAG